MTINNIVLLLTAFLLLILGTVILLYYNFLVIRWYKIGLYLTRKSGLIIWDDSDNSLINGFTNSLFHKACVIFSKIFSIICFIAALYIFIVTIIDIV